MIEVAAAVAGALLMVAVTWAMWVYHQRELDRALSELSRLK